jgi:nicotinamide phosphoribosyltransferase
MSTTFEKNYNTNNNSDFWVSLQKTDPRMKQFIDEVLATHKPIQGRNTNNQILKTDSYKATQYNMGFDSEFNEEGVKERMIGMYASVEPRKGARDSHIIVAGVQAVAKELASIRVNMDDVKDAIVFYSAHFSTPLHNGCYHFNPLPWLKTVLVYNGCLPLEFKAIPEGTIIPVAVPLCTIENTDQDCAQLVSHVEGWLQKAIWYPTTVATNALGYSKAIKFALRQTTTDEITNSWLPFALQDFAYRGCASEDAARIGCGAALYVTMGSDTVPAIEHTMMTMGNGQMLGYSVAAIEHNQAMMQGRAGEFKQVKRVLKAYPNGLLSYVADTYDMRNFVEQISSGELRDLIMARDGTFVIRPDSCLIKEDGTEMSPTETISTLFAILNKNLFDVNTVNSKGFKVLNSHYKVIYGDGLNIPKITAILTQMMKDGWCASNIVFGVGGNLAQRIDRDTERFAMKASEETFLVEDTTGKTWTEVRDVCKETPGKQSKKGRFHIATVDGIVQCFSQGDPKLNHIPNMLECYSVNGNVCRPLDNIETVRARVNEGRRMLDF